jgi:hypothetical protein
MGGLKQTRMADVRVDEQQLTRVACHEADEAPKANFHELFGLAPIFETTG